MGRPARRRTDPAPDGSTDTRAGTLIRLPAGTRFAWWSEARRCWTEATLVIGWDEGPHVVRVRTEEHPVPIPFGRLEVVKLLP